MIWAALAESIATDKQSLNDLLILANLLKARLPVLAVKVLSECTAPVSGGLLDQPEPRANVVCGSPTSSSRGGNRFSSCLTGYTPPKALPHI